MVFLLNNMNNRVADTLNLGYLVFGLMAIMLAIARYINLVQGETIYIHRYSEISFIN
jgi:hypothetical protein